ncbi:MAG: DNA cytosine methyltransferase [Robiginitomaculum sp.]|nr:DNA cytosine methyltransferase [Robiginitomaculum sp.]
MNVEINIGFEMLQKANTGFDTDFAFPGARVSSDLKYTSIDLFSGAGGLSKGLQFGGFHSVAAVEYDTHAAKTFAHNFPNTAIYDEDIRKIDPKKLLSRSGLKVGELDLLAGGPPCQGFSVNAPNRSLDDPRNHLFMEFFRFAKILKPKTILIENVPGIVSLDQGSVVKSIYKMLSDIGYDTIHRILYAGHYGVPQMRFRTIFLATRKNKPKIHPPLPTHNSTARANFGGAKELCYHLSPLLDAHLLNQTTVWDAISDLPTIDQNMRADDFSYNQPNTEYQRYSQLGSDTIKNHYCSKIGKANQARLVHVPQGGSWRDIPHDLLPAGLQRARRSDHTKRYGRLDPIGLASTILTKCDPHWGTFFHPKQDRIISIREAARLQSFPDNFTFLGRLTEQYRQVGNAVPPLLAYAIASAVTDHLEAEYG